MLSIESLFLNEIDKRNIKNWVYQVEDNSISTVLLTPFWNYLLPWIPNTVAPNIITLAGFICLLQSTFITYYHVINYPKLTTFANIMLIFAYMTLDAIDGKHARKIKNSSPMGELFDHTCDNLGVIFIILTMCWNFGIYDLTTIWLILNVTQLIFMNSHIDALKNKIVTFGKWTGPGEVLLICIGLLMARYSGLRVTLPEITNTILILCNVLIGITVVYKSCGLNYSMRNGIIFCILYRFAATMIASQDSDIITVMCSGVFWSVVTGDIILGKMTGRDLHPNIVIFAMMSVLGNMVIIGFSVIYYISVFSDLSYVLNIPMFSPITNVYVNGVFDMCHYGHINLFKSALKFGNRLIVGIMSDEETAKHKRLPIMNLQERTTAVSACTYVSEVIPGAPWDSVPEELIKKYNIHVVAHSAEYDKPEDTYYKIPRDMGITKVLPRTEGMSTSELINRIKQREL